MVALTSNTFIALEPFILLFQTILYERHLIHRDSVHLLGKFSGISQRSPVLSHTEKGVEVI